MDPFKRKQHKKNSSDLNLTFFYVLRILVGVNLMVAEEEAEAAAGKG